MKKLLAAYSISRNFRYLISRPAANFQVLDGMRAISMLMVIAFHSYMMYAYQQPNVELLDMIEAGSYWLSWIVNSDKGVDVFFVLSGFLITGILLKQIDSDGRVHLGNFYLRRFLRLSPVYYFAILLYWLAMGQQPAANTDNLWANVFYVNNFLDYKDQAMNWTWSLAIEEQFYLIFPLLLSLMVTKSHRALCWFWVLWFAAIVIRFGIIMTDEQIRTLPQSALASDEDFHAHHFSLLYDNLYTRYGALLSGCMAAYYFHYHRAKVTLAFSGIKGLMLKSLGLGLVAFFMIMPLVLPRFDEYQVVNIVYQSVNRNLFGLGIAIIILASFEEGWFKKIATLLLGNRLLYPFAQLSYSMYLIHVVPVALAVTQAIAMMKTNPDFSHFDAVFYIFIVSTLLTAFVAMLMYLFIERPIMNLRK